MVNEEAFLKAIVEDFGEDDTWLVYADWLEEQGDAQSDIQAMYLRGVIELARLPEKSPASKEKQKQLNQLACSLSRDWVAIVSRSPIEHSRKQETRASQEIRAEIHEHLETLRDTEDVANTCMDLGRCYGRLGDLEAEEAWHQRALKAAPEEPWPYLYLGNLAYSRYQYHKALEWFQRGREFLPDEALVYWLIGDAYDAMRRPERAGEFYKRAHRLDPHDHTAKSRLDAWYKRQYDLE